MRGDRGKDEEEMSEADGAAGRLEVGDLAFDPESGELTGPVGLSRLAPQPASLLSLLASHPGELLTRDEIRQRLWPGGRVEFEQGIAFAVREVRKAIESVGGDAALLETIPKRGFRLNAPVVAPAAPVPPATTPTTRPRRANSLRLVVPPLGAVVVIAAIGLGVSMMGRPPADLPAVVLFVHDTEDDGHEELAQALGYELTAALTRAFDGRLGIIGPTGSAVLSGPNDTEGARASLGACLVVSGGIRAVGADSVVVFTQVVRTLDRVHAWASQDTVSTSGVGTVVPIAVEGVGRAARAC
jgi:DNA-binding winged helix-turn-helix (wHTH) protein/TolB-like protein